MSSYDTFAILGIGTTELIIIFVIILLLFGSRKLPELARSLGTSMRELKKGVSSDDTATDSKKSDTTSSNNQ